MKLSPGEGKGNGPGVLLQSWWGFGCRRLLGSVLGSHLPPHPPSPSTRHQQPVFGILPGGNSKQHMLEGQPTASVGGLICPSRKYHRHRAPCPTQDMPRAKATPKRRGLEGLSPPTRSISQPRECPASPSSTPPESPFDYAPEPLPGCGRAAKGALRVQSHRQLCAC